MVDADQIRWKNSGQKSAHFLIVFEFRSVTNLTDKTTKRLLLKSRVVTTHCWEWRQMTVVEAGPE